MGKHVKFSIKTPYDSVQTSLDSMESSWKLSRFPHGIPCDIKPGCGLCGLTVERSLAIQKVAGSNLGRSASR